MVATDIPLNTKPHSSGAFVLVRAKGVEPPTLVPGNQRSIQLSYARASLLVYPKAPAVVYCQQQGGIAVKKKDKPGSDALRQLLLAGLIGVASYMGLQLQNYTKAGKLPNLDYWYW